MNKIVNLIAAATLLAGVGTACVPMQHIPANNSNTQNESLERRVTLDDLVSSTYCLLSEREYEDQAGNIITIGGYGSSFAYRDVNGYTYLITNQHVVGSHETERNGIKYQRKKANLKIVDTKYDQNKDDDLPLEVVFESTELDLAVLRTTEELNVLPEKNISLPDNLSYGEEVYLIGYPLAMFLATTQGIIANPGNYPYEFDFEDKENDIVVPYSARKILDLSANPGNSGGPFFVKKEGGFYWGGIISAYFVHSAGGPFHRENTGLTIAMGSQFIKQIADYVIINADELVKERNKE